MDAGVAAIHQDLQSRPKKVMMQDLTANKLSKSMLFLWLALICGDARAQIPVNELFLHPPESAKPGMLWMWMGSNISRKGITEDLEALKAQGFNRTTMYSLSDITTPWAQSIGKSPNSELVAWTEPWWALVRHAALESRRLGMAFGMFNGPGYESSGGPWITPELSMQDICWSRQEITAGQDLHIQLSKPHPDLKGHTPYPVYNPETGRVEIPEIAARGTYYKDIAVLALPAGGVVAARDVVNLTDKMHDDGTLDWQPPAGGWTIYRFGHTTSGTLIQPAQWEAIGLECDKMNPEAIGFHMDHVIGEIRSHLGDLIGTGFTHVYFDSYEAGRPTWTPKMPAEFLSRRGYDLTPYLPVLAGRAVGGPSDSIRFLNDFDATIKDLYRDVYFKTISDKLKAAHLEFICEPYGGPWRQDDIMHMVSTVMTEFWTTKGKYTPMYLEATVASLRRSGQNIIEAEAFTGLPDDSKWTETPAWIKPIGDGAFCDGVNRLVVNRFVEQPWDQRYQPGATFGQWGSHFDRTQTWWKPGKALIEYWQRCQALLQWGGIAPASENDFECSSRSVKWIHRRQGNTDLYFIANTSREKVSAVCDFKTSGRSPELWDPVTKEQRLIPNYKSSEGRTSISLDFAEAQSFFVVFRKAIAGVSPLLKHGPEHLPKPIDISRSWTLSFDPAWGGPHGQVTFDSLRDWTVNKDSGIRYYSGTVVYTKQFDIAGSTSKSPAYLDLGVVRHIARVILNDKDLGVVWTAPWRIRIPDGLLHLKANRLRIEITNVWANRLIGDEQQPPDCEWLSGRMSDVIPGYRSGQFLKEFPEWFLQHQPRPSKGRYCFTTWNYFTKDSPLVPSGLLGPVRIIYTFHVNSGCARLPNHHPH
jgi:hypothetical protein